jgi:hypothetical protein
MALADYAAYKTGLAAPNQQIGYTKAAISGVTGRLSSLWTATPLAGAAPGGNAVPTNATTGSLGQNDGSASLWLAGFRSNKDRAATVILADRLVHTDGLSGTVTTAQTTNLPTTALTRYTSGVGVLAALEIYGALGATATTFTCSYTNSGGTSGRTSPAYPIGSTTYNQVGRFLIMPMQAGDVGVKSVESVTVLASTLTAGNFGVTLFKPLYAHFDPFTFAQGPVVQDFVNTALLPQIQNGACLFVIESLSATASAISHNEVLLIEG